MCYDECNKVKEVTSSDEFSAESSDFGSVDQVSIPDVVQVEDADMDRLIDFAKKIILVFENRKYPDGKVLWKDLISSMDNVGFTVPTKAELNTNGKKRSVMSLLTLAFPELFSKEENSDDTGNPYLVYSKESEDSSLQIQ